MSRGRVIACCIALMAGVGVGCQPEARGARGPAPVALRDLRSARFQATVYEVRLPGDRITGLDAKALAAAGDLRKTLEGLGVTKALYQIDQNVDLAESRITIGKDEPMVTATRKTQTGQVINAVRYQSVGAVFQISVKPTAQGLHATVAVEVAALTESPSRIMENVPAMTIRNTTMGHDGPVELGRPVVMLSADASSRDADGNAIACVCRVVFSEATP